MTVYMASGSSKATGKQKLSVGQRWQPISSEAAVKEEKHIVLDDVSEGCSSHSRAISGGKANKARTTKKMGIEMDMEKPGNGEKCSLSVEVEAPLMNLLKGKDGSVQKRIEDEAGVRITFPSRGETTVVIEGTSTESLTAASEKIMNVLEQAVRNPMLSYTHFISLPLAVHPVLVEKLNHFQRSILGASAFEEDAGSDEDDEDSQMNKSSSKGSTLADLGIDKSIILRPQVFHLTVLMLKLWNEERVAAASEVLRRISPEINNALDNRPIYIGLRGLALLKGSPNKARVLYVPVTEVGGEGRLLCACKVLTDAFIESGLVYDRDANQPLKLHATVMNTSHRRGQRRRHRGDFFDARHILRVHGSKDWGEYMLPEMHLSQRFKYDENGYYHCCASILLPADDDSTAEQ